MTITSADQQQYRTWDHSVHVTCPPPPPPPLTAYIYQDPPTYSAEPSNGYPPYRYNWEFCIRNCDAAPSGGAQVAPNLPIGGWQPYGTTQSVSWSGGQALLLVTVTDSHNQQAEDEISVNSY